jgi:peroxiredoxin
VSAAAPTIAEQVEVMNAGMAAQAPAEILQVFGEEQAGLDAGGVPADAAGAGAAMPDGDLLDVDGAATTLAQARGGKPAVVIFYRGAWCPYCNLTLKAYQDQLVPALADTGYALIAISPQKPDGSLTMQEKHALTFTVLSDPGNALAGQLGILSPETSDASREAAAAFGIDVAAANADGTDRVPMPTTVLVDAGGTIAWIDIHPNYATRTEPQQILDAIAAQAG